MSSMESNIKSRLRAQKSQLEALKSALSNLVLESDTELTGLNSPPTRVESTCCSQDVGVGSSHYTHDIEAATEEIKRVDLDPDVHDISVSQTSPNTNDDSKESNTTANVSIHRCYSENCTAALERDSLRVRLVQLQALFEGAQEEIRYLRERCSDLEEKIETSPPASDDFNATFEIDEPKAIDAFVQSERLSPEKPQGGGLNRAALLDCPQKFRPKPPYGRRQPQRHKTTKSIHDTRSSTYTASKTIEVQIHGDSAEQACNRNCSIRSDDSLKFFANRLHFEMLSNKSGVAETAEQESKVPDNYSTHQYGSYLGNENINQNRTKDSHWSRHALERSEQRGIVVRRLESIKKMPKSISNDGAIKHRDKESMSTYVCRGDTVVTVFR